MKNLYEKYKDKFNELKFWTLLKNAAKRLGTKAVYSALLMFYAYKRKDTPAWAKRIVIGTLGYLLAPIDAIPDLTPFIGFTDDIGILSLGVVAIAGFINEEVKGKAKSQLEKWFGDFDKEDVEEVDAQL
ncbi:MAG TPA: YkvA family protein [Saprospiraceae bacterium]|nr:YkvA family protein [Saprospiraceae bacterium]